MADDISDFSDDQIIFEVIYQTIFLFVSFLWDGRNKREIFNSSQRSCRDRLDEKQDVLNSDVLRTYRL